jgi:hypothetical protein
MQEVQIKQQEVQLKAQQAQAQNQLEQQKVQNSVQFNAQKLELEKGKLEGNLQLEAMKVGADVQRNKLQQKSTEEQAGLRTGIEIAKHKQELALRNRQTSMQPTQKTTPPESASK